MTNRAGMDDSETSSFEHLNVIYERGKRSWRLLIILVVAGFILSLPAIALSSRSYTASATIAPAISLASSQSMTGGASSALSALAGKSSLLGGSEVSPFDMYMSVLSSKRLAVQLANKDGFLQIVYAQSWDARNHRWKSSTSLLHPIRVAVQGALGITSKAHPDTDDLSAFLSKALVLKNTESDTSPVSLIMKVNLSYHDRELTTWMLNTILSEADSILRTERRADVAARIAYLNRELSAVTLAEQRQALIEILSSQEEEFTVLQADKRYAFTLLDPPYTPQTPTWPIPLLFVAGFLFLAVTVWGVLIAVMPDSSAILRLGKSVRMVGRPPRSETGLATGTRVKSTS